MQIMRKQVTRDIQFGAGRTIEQINSTIKKQVTRHLHLGAGRHHRNSIINHMFKKIKKELHCKNGKPRVLEIL